MTFDPAAVATQPRRRVARRFWHQGSTRWPLESCPDPARSDGRYHRLGGRGVWYASSQEQGAWAELFRHFTHEGVDPFEVLRRVGSARVDLEVLDLTNAAVREAIGVTAAELVDDDCAIPRDIADAARAAGFEGILAPAAALPGRETLVVFNAAMAKVTPERSAVRQPPPRLADFLAIIRPSPDVPAALRRTLNAIRLAGSDAIRRLRQR